MHASAIVGKSNRKTGKMYMSAPVLIKIGGKMIRLKFVGLSAALIRMNTIAVAMNIAMMVLKMRKYVLFKSDSDMLIDYAPV